MAAATIPGLLKKLFSTHLICRISFYLPYDPGEPEEEHDPPDVEEAPHEHPVEPAELDDTSYGVIVSPSSLLRPSPVPPPPVLEGVAPLVPRVDRLLVKELVQGGAVALRLACKKCVKIRTFF